MKDVLKHQIPTVLWVLFILILCSIKLGSIGDSPMFFPGFDKLVHCGMFFVLTMLMCSGSIRGNEASNITVGWAFFMLGVAVLYGGIIEVLQAYIFTWRDGEWGDLFADSVGAAMAIFGVLLINWSVKNAYKKA